MAHFSRRRRNDRRLRARDGRNALPVLCFNGTRDALCTRALMERALMAVKAPWQMHWIEGADHSFHVLKSSGRTDEDVMNEVGAAASTWVEHLARSRLNL
jgi:predicted alpha/beta-hydrolase family hydrolase